jgi:hypothetical protein
MQVASEALHICILEPPGDADSHWLARDLLGYVEHL